MTANLISESDWRGDLNTGGGGLPVGGTVRARVTADLGDGRYELRVGANSLNVSSRTALPVGRELELRVSVEDGRLMLREAAAVTADGDRLALAARLAIQTDLGTLAARLSGAGGGNTAIGLAAGDGQLALHFSTGEVLAGELAAGPTAAAGDGEAAAQGLDQSVLLPRRVSVPVELTLASGATRTVELDVAAADLPKLVEWFARQAGQPAEAVRDALLQLLVGTGEDFNARLLAGSGGAIRLADLVGLQALGSARLSGELILTPAENLAEGALDQALRAAGLSPSPQSREAATALLAQGAPVTRESVSALLALAADRTGAARDLLLAGGARVLARDLPLAAPLAQGLGELLTAAVPADELLAGAEAALRGLAADPALAGRTDLSALAGAADDLAGLMISLDLADTPQQLAGFLKNFGQPALAGATQSLENAAGALLAGDPKLARLDAALGALTDGPTDPEAARPNAQAGTGSPPPVPGRGLPGPVAPGLLAGSDAAGLKSGSETASAGPAASGQSTPGTAGAPATGDGRGLSPERLAQLAERILNAPDRETAARIGHELSRELNDSARRQLTEHLGQVEREAIRQEPGLQRLASTSASLQEVERRFLAYKAENLAGQRQEPGVFVGEVPFQLGSERGEGRLQMFYRRAAGGPGGKRWSARVILDLQTTQLGPVVGDMRFFGHDLALTLYASDEETRAWLADNAEDLSAALREKGFNLTPRFSLIARNRSAPEPAPAKPSPSSGEAAGPTRLDLRV